MTEEILEQMRLDKIKRMEAPSDSFADGHWLRAYLNFKENMLDRRIRIETKKLEIAKLKHERKNLK